MESRVSYTAVGLFVLVLTSVLVGIVFWLVGGGQIKRHYDTYQAHFDESVAGLNHNAPVRFRGVEVGRVTDIALAPDGSGRVRVLMRIDRATPLKEDTVASLRMQGLTGLASIELSGGSPGAKPLRAAPGEAYPQIATRASLLSRLDTEVSTLIGNLNQTSANVNALTDAEMRASLKATLAHVEAVTAALSSQRGALEAALANASRTFEHSAAAAQEFRVLVQRLNATAQAVEQGAQALTQAGYSTAAALEETRIRLRDVAGQTLPEVNALTAEMRELAASLKRVSAELEQHPEMLLFGRRPGRPGPGE